MAVLPSVSGPSAPLSSEEMGELRESIAAAKKAPASGAGDSCQPVPNAVGRAQLASTRAHVFKITKRGQAKMLIFGRKIRSERASCGQF